MGSVAGCPQTLRRKLIWAVDLVFRGTGYPLRRGQVLGPGARLPTAEVYRSGLLEEWAVRKTTIRNGPVGGAGLLRAHTPLTLLPRLLLCALR